MGWIKHRRGAPAQPPPGIASGSQSIPYHTQNKAWPKDVFILVMGPTGSGKTSFIDLCSDASSFKVRQGLRSCTEFIAEATFQHKGYSIHMIETPGFDDASRSDSEILMEVAFYLATTYEHHMRIDGLIYVTHITDTRMTGTNRKNLIMLSKLVGEEVFSKVALATSMWDNRKPLQEAEAREEELIRTLWKPFIDKGSIVYRLYRDRNTALCVLDALLPGHGSNGEVLSIQRELVDQSRPLIDTEAGQELAQELQNLEQKIRDDVGSLKADFDSLTAKEDASVAEAMHREIDHLDFRISQAQKEQNKLHVDFRRLKEDSDKKLRSLMQQIMLERSIQAADMDKLNDKLHYLSIEALSSLRQRLTGGDDGASSGVERKTLSQTSAEASKMKGLQEQLAKPEEKWPNLEEEQLAELEEKRANLEEERLAELKEKWANLKEEIANLNDERANLRKEIAQKGARMKDLRSFLFKHILDSPAGPPPPYSEPDLSAKGVPTTPKAQDSIEDYDTSQGPSSDDGDNHDGLKSPLARRQNHSFAAGSLRHKLRGTKNPTTSQQSVYRRRAEYEARRQLQAELSEHSLQSYVDFSRTSLSKHHLNRLASVGLDPMISTLKVNGIPSAQEEEYRDYLTNPSQDPEESSEQTRVWFFAEVLMCRNMALTVYANCRRLQDADFAREFVSVLALAPQSIRARVVTMKRLIVGQVHELAESLAECTRHLHQTNKQPALPRLQTSILEIHNHFRSILVSIGLYDYMTTLEKTFLADALEALLKNPYEDHNAPLTAIFCEWRCACQVLDLGVLAYEGAHVSNVHEQFLANRSDSFELPERSLSLPYTKTSNHISKRIHYRRLGLRCLSPFLEGREVWVFDSTMEQQVPPLYLLTDIETFADVWGPMWKVRDRTHPDLFSKYNVGGGSILPYEFDADMHPMLGANERLCHWKSSTAYIQDSERSSLGLSSSSSSSSSTSSEAEESAAHEPVLMSFTGFENLLIGADQSPRLQWKPCTCPVDNLKQHLKNAGRLDHIIASKSYRYVDSQQNSLVVGSHGVQVGQSRTWKDKKEEPLKKSLLDVWENEADSRDPREFENFWGVAVSLCTMNAQRVRLVELLGEDSVFALLRHFPWSDLSPDGARSNVRKQYLKAVRSYNPLALGDLWDRHPSWRKDLGNAILVCLRIMFRTGYDDNRDEFHMLWLPPQCRAPRRVTLKPADQSWVKFLKDTTYSVTVAVIVEDSLGSRYRCSGNRPRWFKTPSILETAICINSTLDPAPKLIQRSGCQDENHYLIRKNFEEWQSTWDVSAIESGVHLWMHSQTRVRIICPLTKWHLLLEVDTVKRLILREMIGMKPTERIGHWEYTDEELDGDDVRPIPVHITS